MRYASFDILRGLILCNETGTLISKNDLIKQMEHMEIIATDDSIRKVFSDLSKEKEIIRVCNGIYYRTNKAFPDTIPAPSLDNILSAIARDNSWIIRPGTEMARKMLGLAFDQKYEDVYACSGTTYFYKLDIGGSIHLQKYSGKFMTSPSVPEKAAIVTIALLDLEKHNITAQEVAYLSDKLSDSEKEDLMRARPYIPARLRPIFELICGRYGILSR